MWGYDFSEFPEAGTQRAGDQHILSRKWIETMTCGEVTDVQVQVLFTRALEREGLLDVISSLIDEHAAGEQEDEFEPILLGASDYGAQMRLGSTREFMALGRHRYPPSLAALGRRPIRPTSSRCSATSSTNGRTAAR